MRQCFLFFVALWFLSVLHAEVPIENQLQTLQSSIQLKLQESQKQYHTMETQLRYLQQTSQAARPDLEQRLLTFQTSWNNTLMELQTCYKDINTLNNILTKERTKTAVLTKILIVLIALIIIPIVAKIVIRVLQLKGVPFPKTLTFWL